MAFFNAEDRDILLAKQCVTLRDQGVVQRRKGKVCFIQVTADSILSEEFGGERVVSGAYGDMVLAALVQAGERILKNKVPVLMIISSARNLLLVVRLYGARKLLFFIRLSLKSMKAIY